MLWQDFRLEIISTHKEKRTRRAPIDRDSRNELCSCNTLIDSHEEIGKLLILRVLGGVWLDVKVETDWRDFWQRLSKLLRELHNVIGKVESLLEEGRGVEYR